MSIRPVKKLITAKPTLEGAGVHLRRAFGFGQTSDSDPFLLLDDFATTCERITWRAAQIAMNTQAELRQASDQREQGTFLKRAQRK
jgi:hypothetical protein